MASTFNPSLVGTPDDGDGAGGGSMPSAIGYWVGAGLMVAGIIGGVIWAVVGYNRMTGMIDDFDRVAVPATSEVRLDRGDYTVYVEGSGVSSGFYTIPDVEILDPDGSTVFVRGYGGSSNSSLTYSFGRDGAAVYTFSARVDGAYEVTTAPFFGSESVSTGNIAIGDSIGPVLVSMIVGAMGVGGLGVVAGGLVMIVTGVRRGKAKRLLRSPYPPPGYGVGYGAGHPPPPPPVAGSAQPPPSAWGPAPPPGQWPAPPPPG